MIHKLKSDRASFIPVFAGLKPYEIRFDDRGYRRYDVLILNETVWSGEEMKQGKPLAYIGRVVEAVVIHILKDPVYGLQEGWVILSLKIVNKYDLKYDLRESK
ncbi:MAG: DUF3850 domain-containing protein [Smithella sp.]